MIIFLHFADTYFNSEEVFENVLLCQKHLTLTSVHRRLVCVLSGTMKSSEAGLNEAVSLGFSNTLYLIKVTELNDIESYQHLCILYTLYVP